MPDNQPRWPPRRILLGYDGSEGALDAVELCRLIAPADAQVIVVDVPPYAGTPTETVRLLGSAEFPTPEDYFDPAVSRLSGCRVETVLASGDSPPRLLEDIADEREIDLVVVGSPHRGTLGRILLGSVSEALLRSAPLPILTAPHGYAGRAPEALRSIGVAYDGGEASQAALAEAQAIAAATPEARLEVLTVDRPTDPVAGAIAYTMSIPEDTDEIQRRALSEVDPSIDLRRRVLSGETVGALASACDDSVDLIVVGSRGRGLVERALLGSTSDGLVRQASCPVLVVPPIRPSGGRTGESARGSRADAAA